MAEPRNRAHSIELVAERDLDELLPLLRAYCDFYAANPAEGALRELSRTLIADPEREGVQLLARSAGRHAAVGFATVFWSWDTTEAGRIGIMHDLYVAPEARGRGLADQLIEACLALCSAHGASRLDWQTAPDNIRAQSVYDRAGGVREPWLLYTAAVPRA
jgi:GNAT superfamily N-acetyltransferase